MPPAPARFSTTNDWPKLSLSLLATMRPSVSAVPPGAKGTTTRTGFAGQPCANADAVNNSASAQIAVNRVAIFESVSADKKRSNEYYSRGDGFGKSYVALPLLRARYG